MLNIPKSKIIQVSTSVSQIDGGTPVLITVALCEDGTVWQLDHNLITGAILDDGWEQYPTGGVL